MRGLCGAESRYIDGLLASCAPLGGAILALYLGFPHTKISIFDRILPRRPGLCTPVSQFREKRLVGAIVEALPAQSG